MALTLGPPTWATSSWGADAWGDWTWQVDTVTGAAQHSAWQAIVLSSCFHWWIVFLLAAASPALRSTDGRLV